MNRYRLPAILLFLGACLLAQAPILDVQTGTRCTASLTATDVTLDCTKDGRPVLTGAKINLAAITGQTAGVVIGFNAGDAVTVLFRRPAPEQPLHIEAAVNGTTVVSKDIPIP